MHARIRLVPADGAAIRCHLTNEVTDGGRHERRNPGGVQRRGGEDLHAVIGTRYRDDSDVLLIGDLSGQHGGVAEGVPLALEHQHRHLG